MLVLWIILGALVILATVGCVFAVLDMPGLLGLALRVWVFVEVVPAAIDILCEIFRNVE